MHHIVIIIGLRWEREDNFRCQGKVIDTFDYSKTTLPEAKEACVEQSNICGCLFINREHKVYTTHSRQDISREEGGTAFVLYR